MTPCGPVAPVAPIGPVAPVAPAGPAGPVAPVALAAPAAPVAPVIPVAPIGPMAPVGPVAPVAPVAPLPAPTPVAHGPNVPVAVSKQTSVPCCAAEPSPGTITLPFASTRKRTILPLLSLTANPPPLGGVTVTSCAQASANESAPAMASASNDRRNSRLCMSISKNLSRGLAVESIPARAPNNGEQDEREQQQADR